MLFHEDGTMARRQKLFELPASPELSKALMGWTTKVHVHQSEKILHVIAQKRNSAQSPPHEKQKIKNYNLNDINHLTKQERPRSGTLPPSVQWCSLVCVTLDLVSIIAVRPNTS